ncbi:MAG: hypothetical protein IRZ14_07895 [Chloroflexi bacterium]|nr:hypothetical protein [Chloroflexota bacterium]
MGLLDWDYDELAQHLQTGLDRLTMSFLRGHRARVRRDAVDFHGFEHIELELAHGGHRLYVRQYGPALDQAPPPVALDTPAREFVSTFDDRPTATVPRVELVRWLASLPAGEAPPERPSAEAVRDNPFAPGPPRREPPPKANPFLAERSQPSQRNPFAPPSPEERRREALRWLQSDD